MDGNHSIERSAQVTQKTLALVVKFLHDYNIFWEGCLFKVRPCPAFSLSPSLLPPVLRVHWSVRLTLE